MEKIVDRLEPTDRVRLAQTNSFVFEKVPSCAAHVTIGPNLGEVKWEQLLFNRYQSSERIAAKTKKPLSRIFRHTITASAKRIMNLRDDTQGRHVVRDIKWYRAALENNTQGNFTRYTEKVELVNAKTAALIAIMELEKSLLPKLRRIYVIRHPYPIRFC